MNKYIIKYGIITFTLIFLSLSAYLYSDTSYGVITSKKGLNIRNEANRNAKILGLVPYGNFVIIISDTHKKEIIDNEQGSWYKIRWNDIEGYAFSAFIKESKVNVSIINKKPIFKSKYYSGGIDCSGSTFSEYKETIEIINNEIIYTNEGAIPITCKVKDPSVPVGYGAIYSEKKYGSFSIRNGYIDIIFIKKVSKMTPSDQCIDKKKTESIENINESYKAFPVICKSSRNIEGFIIPGLGVYMHAIWVPKLLNNN